MVGKPTCSCTIAKLEGGKTATIKPGVSTTIDLDWNTKEMPQDYSQGATFGTNDPRMPTFMLSITGKVYPPVVIYPPQMIQFPRVSNEEPHKARIAVYSQERPDLKVTKVTSSKPGLIVAEAKPMTADEAKQLKIEKGYLVSVELKPGMPLGNFHEELVVHTDHPKQPEVKVSVGGSTFGPISVTPERLRMPDVVGKVGASRDLLLIVRGGREMRVQGGAQAREGERDHRAGGHGQPEGPLSDDRHRAARHGRRGCGRRPSCSRPTTPTPAG